MILKTRMNKGSTLFRMREFYCKESRNSGRINEEIYKRTTWTPTTLGKNPQKDWKRSRTNQRCGKQCGRTSRNRMFWYVFESVLFSLFSFLELDSFTVHPFLRRLRSSRIRTLHHRVSAVLIPRTRLIYSSSVSRLQSSRIQTSHHTTVSCMVLVLLVRYRSSWISCQFTYYPRQCLPANQFPPQTCIMSRVQLPQDLTNYKVNWRY